MFKFPFRMAFFIGLCHIAATGLYCVFILTRYVFKRLRFLGNKSLSWILAMAFISLWHGVWPGYYITFSLEMLEVMAERSVNRTVMIGDTLS